jgi:hypothetical protein
MTVTDTQRNKIVQWCHYFNEHANQIGYEQIRPFPLYKEAELESKINAGDTLGEWDCVGSSDEIFYLVGLKDPTGFDYVGDGNTDTMLAYLKDHYTDPAHAKPGALVIFGADLPLSSQHVCIVTESGSDPQLFSHGEAFECKLLTLSEEQTAHTGSTVFLSIDPL